MASQTSDPLLEKMREYIKEGNEGKAEGFTLFKDGSIHYKGHWCVSSTGGELKDKILREAHSLQYSVHPGGDKMY